MAEKSNNRARMRSPKPLDREGLERLAIHYVGRYATTAARLRTYLARKVKERGWSGDQTPDLSAIVDRIVALGYIDDAAFAEARAESLVRRGYGARRIAPTLRAAGIDGDITRAVLARREEGAEAAALAFARRKRIGPFGPADPDRKARDKAYGAMMRAGHSSELVRRVLGLSRDDVQIAN